jgi:uncharacterized protein with PIN domain
MVKAIGNMFHLSSERLEIAGSPCSLDHIERAKCDSFKLKLTITACLYCNSSVVEVSARMLRVAVFDKNKNSWS